MVLLTYHNVMYSEKAAGYSSETRSSPNDEFSSQWYLMVGSPVAFGMILQIAWPHLVVFVHFIYLQCVRHHDRYFTFNIRRTRQASQSAYEDMYTGPEFILQLRLAQVMSVIFVTMSLSSGMPILYLVCVVVFFVTYWVDKYLLLRFFRMTEGYTKFLTQNVIALLPLAVVLHVFFGFFILSAPNILTS